MANPVDLIRERAWSISSDDEGEGATAAGAEDPEEMKKQAEEFTKNVKKAGAMISGTLASEPDGIPLQSLVARFINDWDTDPNKVARSLGCADLEQLLNSGLLSEYVEDGFRDEMLVYYSKNSLQNEHILRYLADEHLRKEQLKEKQKAKNLIMRQKLSESAIYMTGKKRILEILLELEAHKYPINYTLLQNLYLVRYERPLNGDEHFRLFGCSKASKNLLTVFYNEIKVLSERPMTLMLTSPNIKLPEVSSDVLKDGERNQSLPRYSIAGQKTAASRSVEDNNIRSGILPQPTVLAKNSTILHPSSNETSRTCDNAIASVACSTSQLNSRGQARESDSKQNSNELKYTDDENTDSSEEDASNVSRGPNFCNAPAIVIKKPRKSHSMVHRKVLFGDRATPYGQLESVKNCAPSTMVRHDGRNCPLLPSTSADSNQIKQLANALMMLVTIRRCISLSDVPFALSTVYGYYIDPPKDPIFGISWIELVQTYCGDVIAFEQSHGGKEVMLVRKNIRS